VQNDALSCSLPGCLLFKLLTLWHLQHVQPTLNAFMALGRDVWREARATITRLLTGLNPIKFLSMRMCGSYIFKVLILLLGIHGDSMLMKVQIEISSHLLSIPSLKSFGKLSKRALLQLELWFPSIVQVKIHDWKKMKI
jgi:hypothetical protein